MTKHGPSTVNQQFLYFTIEWRCAPQYATVRIEQLCEYNITVIDELTLYAFIIPIRKHGTLASYIFSCELGIYLGANVLKIRIYGAS